MELLLDRRSRVRLLIVVVLVLGMVGSGAVAGIDGASPAAAQPEVPDPEADDAAEDEDDGVDEADTEDDDGSEIPVGPADTEGGDAGDDDSEDAEDDDEGVGIGGDDPEGTDAEDDSPEEPPEGVSAEEYYDDEQLDEWQEYADEMPEIDDVRDLEAQEAHDIFVLAEEREEETEEGTTEQVGPSDGAPSAGELLEGGAAWFAEAAAGLVEFVFEGSLELVVGTPVPENAGWLGIFGEPTNEPFTSLFTDLHETWLFPLTLAFFLFALLIGASVLPFSGFIGKYNASKWITMAFATILAISLSWPIVTAMHAMADAVAMSIAPSGEELIDSEGIETIVASAGPAAAALYVGLGVKMIVYAFLFGMRYFLLLMVLPYIFGLALAVSLFAPWRKLRTIASGVLWVHVSLLVIPIVVAILFRGAYVIDWGFGVEGLANLLLVMGLLVATVLIPVWMMYKATAMTGMVAGAVGGAGTSLAARDSYKPKSIGYAKSTPGAALAAGQSIRNAPNRAREVGKSARAMPSRMADRATALRNGDLDGLRPSFSSPSSSSASSSGSSSPSGSGSGAGSRSGGTQAERIREHLDDSSKNVKSLDQILNDRNQSRNHSGGAD